MKKNLFSIGFLACSLTIGAQVVCHVDEGGIFFVGKSALVYNGGGLQMKGNAIYENHGNVMVVGNATTDVFRTITSAGANKAEGSSVVNFINKLNEPEAYNQRNSNIGLTPIYTYGQLYLKGIAQDNITGIVDQEFRSVNHGAYQQIGFPFYNKSASTLNSELGKTFSTTRRSQNEILRYNNTDVVFDNIPSLNFKLGADEPAFTYYSIGGSGLDVSTKTRVLKGRPVSDVLPSRTTVTLENAGAAVDFGPNGSKINGYGGRYNSYLYDGFEISNGGAAWVGNFGKNIYQFANPYLTNIDLSLIKVAEPGVPDDGNTIENLYGIRVEATSVNYNPNTGGGSSAIKYITYGSGSPTGDVDYTMVRPFGAFSIKLTNNTLKPTFNFSTLRRFKYFPRGINTGYGVSANKGIAKSTVKQLGVIGLDAADNEIERTYYIVGDKTVSGYSKEVKAQIGAVANQLFGTFEEDAVQGGYDKDHASYWLYLNEANENDFKGKSIKLVNYNSNIVKFKFELRENAVLVEEGTHQLSQGEGFYYRKEGEKGVNKIMHNAVANTVPGNYEKGVEYNLYYGEPDAGTLATENLVKKNSTLVVYNPDTDNYFIKFDPSWKGASVQVYDMSGKLVHTALKVSTSSRYELPLPSATAAYVVHVTSQDGEKVVSKILR